MWPWKNRMTWGQTKQISNSTSVVANQQPIMDRRTSTGLILLNLSSTLLACPDTWAGSGGSCYHVTEEQLSWESARQVLFVTCKILLLLLWICIFPYDSSIVNPEEVTWLKSPQKLSRYFFLLPGFVYHKRLFSLETRPPCSVWSPLASTTGWASTILLRRASGFGRTPLRRQATPTGMWGSPMETATAPCWWRVFLKSARRKDTWLISNLWISQFYTDFLWHDYACEQSVDGEIQVHGLCEMEDAGCGEWFLTWFRKFCFLISETGPKCTLWNIFYLPLHTMYRIVCFVCHVADQSYFSNFETNIIGSVILLALCRSWAKKTFDGSVKW